MPQNVAKTCSDEHAAHDAAGQKVQFSSLIPVERPEGIPTDIILATKRKSQLEMSIDISSQQTERADIELEMQYRCIIVLHI